MTLFDAALLRLRREYRRAGRGNRERAWRRLRDHVAAMLRAERAIFTSRRNAARLM